MVDAVAGVAGGLVNAVERIAQDVPSLLTVPEIVMRQPTQVKALDVLLILAAAPRLRERELEEQRAEC